MALHKRLMWCELLLVSCLLVTCALASSPISWRGKAIYQLVTDRFAKGGSASNDDDQCYSNVPCGGTWSGISNNVDYIKEMGFDAVGISPILLNGKLKWDGYWPRTFTDLDTKYGSSDDLSKLVQTIKSKGMLTLVDVILNHVGTNNVKKVNPFNKSDYYHSECEIDDRKNLQQLTKCWISERQADLNQTVDFVRDTLVETTKNILSTYSFDGARVPFAVNIDRWFLAYLQENIPTFLSAQANYQTTSVDIYAGYSYLLPSIMNYPLYYAMIEAFTGSQGGLTEVSQVLNNGFAKYQDPDVVGNFIDTDDTPRLLFRLEDDADLFFNGLALILTSRGMPVVYYGTEQRFYGEGGNVAIGQNRPSLWPEYDTTSEAYTFIKTILQHRKNDGLYAREPHTDLYVDADVYAFSRGSFFIAAITRKTDEFTISIPAPVSIQDNVLFCSIFDNTMCATVRGGRLILSFNGRPLLLQISSSSSTSTAATSGTSGTTGATSTTGTGSSTTRYTPNRTPTPLSTTTPKSPTPKPTDSGSDSGSRDDHTAIAVGLTIGLALPIALLAFAILVFFYIKRKRYADIDSTSGVVNSNQTSGYTL